MITWIKNTVQKLLRTASAPTQPAPSAFSNEARQAADERQRDYELEMAKIREQARRSAM